MPSTSPSKWKGDVARSDRVGRIGVYYFRGLAGQAGLTQTEPSPGEDYRAVDLFLHLGVSAVGVQVKTLTCPTRHRDDTYSITLKADWCRKWDESQVPVFLVLVVLSKGEFADWVDHQMESTTWHAHAYWTRVDHVQPGTVRVSVHNRVKLDTFAEWEKQVRESFVGGQGE